MTSEVQGLGIGWIGSVTEGGVIKVIGKETTTEGFDLGVKSRKRVRGPGRESDWWPVEVNLQGIYGVLVNQIL